MEKVAVFIDYENLSKALDREKLQIDLLALRDYLSEGRALKEIFCYLGLSPIDSHAENNLCDLLMANGFFVRLQSSEEGGSLKGRTLLIDCGQTANFSPIKYLVENELIDTANEGEYTFSEFILSHPHGDHIDDIDRLKVYKPKIICRQKEYDWDAVKEVNTESGAEKVDIYKEWQATYNLPATDPDWGFDLYHNDYLIPKQAEELEKSKMLNNSSMPVLITFTGAKYIQKFLFPGDLEQKGWLELLKRKSFKEAIKNTTFFITSHHGHTSGYCKEIFDAMGKPLLNIVSTHSGDENVEAAYSNPENAIGIDFDGNVRYMLSTRKDNNICIDVESSGYAWVGCCQFDDNLE